MIPDEAVEAAARAIFGFRGRDWTVLEELTCTSQAKRALEAAAPHVMAEAWDDGAKADHDWNGEVTTPNPYRSQAA